MDALKWTTVEYPITDFAPIGKVITQRDVLEKYKADNPGQEIKALTGFKCDQQDKTVSLRIGVADNTIAADSGTVAKITLTGADGSKIKGEQAENGVRGDSVPTYGGSLKSITEDIKQTIKTVEGGEVGENPCLCGACADNIKFQREYDAIVILYDKLEVRYSKLIEKYDALVKENDRLILRLAEMKDIEDMEAAGNKEPVPLPEIGSDTNTFDAAMRKGCDQADCIGPDEDDDIVPEGDEDE